MSIDTLRSVPISRCGDWRPAHAQATAAQTTHTHTTLSHTHMSAPPPPAPRPPHVYADLLRLASSPAAAWPPAAVPPALAWAAAAVPSLGRAAGTEALAALPRGAGDARALADDPGGALLDALAGRLAGEAPPQLPTDAVDRLDRERQAASAATDAARAAGDAAGANAHAARAALAGVGTGPSALDAVHEVAASVAGRQAAAATTLAHLCGAPTLARGAGASLLAAAGALPAWPADGAEDEIATWAAEARLLAVAAPAWPAMAAAARAGVSGGGDTLPPPFPATTIDLPSTPGSILLRLPPPLVAVAAAAAGDGGMFARGAATVAVRAVAAGGANADAASELLLHLFTGGNVVARAARGVAAGVRAGG